MALDVIVFRPMCPPGGSRLGCFSVGGDALGVYSMARLLSWGKGLINPITYELAGGYEAPFIGKPPALVSYLGGLLWLADRPPVVLLAIVVVIGAAAVALLRGRSANPVRRVVEVAVPVFVVLWLLAGNPELLARVATSAVALMAIPVVALLGRRLVDERVGVVAACFAALAPAVWVNASMMNVETLYVVALPLVLLATLRAADDPTPARYAQLGAAALLLSLTRLEGAALVALLVIGLVITNHRSEGWVRRVGLAGMALAIVAVPLAGWSALNTARSGRNVAVSAGGGGVLWSGACDEVTYGALKGFWTFCTPTTTITAKVALTEAVDDLVALPGYAEAILDPSNPVLGRAMVRPQRSVTTASGVAPVLENYRDVAGTMPDGSPGVGIFVDDQPVMDLTVVLQPGQELLVHPNPISGFSEGELDQAATRRSVRYYGDRVGDLPGLAAARVGRVIGVFRPAQTSNLEALVEGRERWQAWGALGVWWVMAPLALVGAVQLRGRRPVWPFAAVAVLVVAVAAVSLGIPRYRLGLDLVACVLAAVPLTGWLVKRWPAGFRRLATDRPFQPAPEADPTTNADTTADADGERPSTQVGGIDPNGFTES